MQYSIRAAGDGADIEIKGRLTFSEAATFPKILAELDKMGKEHWDIHLGGLDFIDSTGMSLFVHIYDSASTAGTKVVIRGATGAVRQSLDRAAFETLFEFQ